MRTSGAPAALAIVIVQVALSCGGGQAQRPSVPCQGQPLASEVCIKGGVFVMGHDRIPTTDSSLAQLQAPPHKVSLRPFFIDDRPVTNGEYLTCLNAGVCPDECQTQGTTNSVGQAGCDGGTWQLGAFFPNYHLRDPNLDRHPVVTIQDRGAEAYCAWVGKRLPTEAERERAARGPDDTDYPWGNAAPDCSRWGCDIVALNSDDTGRSAFWPVGTYPVDLVTGDVSPEGARMMVTGVPEFLHDWYYDYPYDNGAPIPNPEGEPGVLPPNGYGQSLRGNIGAFIPLFTPELAQEGYNSEPFPQPAWARGWGFSTARSVLSGGIRCARNDDAPGETTGGDP